MPTSKYAFISSSHYQELHVRQELLNEKVAYRMSDEMQRSQHGMFNSNVSFIAFMPI